MKKTLGFIGLGMMGLPMAINLAQRSGFNILAYDSSEKPFSDLQQNSDASIAITRAPTLQALGDCQFVITMLPNSSITSAVVAGSNGSACLATILKPGSTIIDMGSSDPIETIRLVNLLKKHDIRLIDAPVSGAVKKARTGELSIMVGGDETAVEFLKPILSHMGTKIVAAGKPGAAHAMKALNNYVYAAGLLAAVEACTIAEKMGLDTDVFVDVLNASSGKNIATETKLKQFVLPRAYAGGFSLSLQAKDLATAHNLKKQAGICAPELDLCASLWADAARKLEPGADNTAIHQYILASEKN